jgi:hypothetical protein
MINKLEKLVLLFVGMTLTFLAKVVRVIGHKGNNRL